MLCIKSGWLMEAVYVAHHVVRNWSTLPASCVRSLPASCVRYLPASCVRSLPASCVRSLPASCVRSLTNTSLKYCSDNCEAQMSRRWQNSFIVHCQVCATVYGAVRSVHITLVSFSLDCGWLIAFPCSSQNYPVLEADACSSAFVCLCVLWLWSHPSP